MAKQPSIEQDGTITEALSNAMLKVEMSPYDLTKGRITFRYKN